MPHTILAPLDGSELATSVLPHVVAITQVLQSSITLLRVLDSSAPFDSAHVGPATAGAVNPIDWQLNKIESQAYLDALGLRLTTCITHPAEQMPTVDTVEGPAANRILEYTQKHNYDLLALCRHGQGGLSEWDLGSVAQKVIDRAHTSMLIVPGLQPQQKQAEVEWCDFRYRRILVPLDGSQRAEHVLPVATALAQHFEAELLLAHVVRTPERIERLPLSSEESNLSDQLLERNRTQATRYLEELQTRLSPKPQLHLLVDESVSNTLQRFVEEQAVDLVILSAHGHTGRQQSPYGTVTSSFHRTGTTTLLVLQDMPAYETSFAKTEQLTEQSSPPANPATNPASGDPSAESGSTKVALAS